MAKETGSEADFLALARAKLGEPGPGAMKLKSFPTAPKKSLEDMLAFEAAQQASPSVVDADTGGEAHRAAPQRLQEADAANDAGRLGRYVPLTALRSHRWNARVHRSMTRIRELASELATGQNAPIHIAAKPDEPGVYYVIDGETRFQASQLLEAKEIWALEIDVDVNDAEAVYLESHKRTNATELISPIDDGIQYRGLLDAGISTIDSLAAGKGVHRSVISRMLSYSQFPEQVLTYMHEHADRFPYSIAAALTPLIDRFADEEKLLMYCKQVVDAELSRREIEAFVKGEVAPKKSRQPKKTALIARTIKTPQGVIGSFRTFESGAVEFKLGPAHGLPPEMVAALIEQLSQATDKLINAGSPANGADRKSVDSKSRPKSK